MSFKKASRSRVQDRILSILEEGPSYGYEIFRQLGSDYGDLRLNTLYRWLVDMEENSLIHSEISPGPLGPNRRVYSITMGGKKQVHLLLRDSIQLLLNFYDDYRRFLINNLEGILKHVSSVYPSGHTLLLFGSGITKREQAILDFITERCRPNPVYAVGDKCIISGSKKKLRLLGGSLTKIPSRSNSFNEIWVTKLPEREYWSDTLNECKRVLKKGGRIWILPAFAYLIPPFQHTIEDFLRVTAVHLFPNLGVIESESLRKEIQASFSEGGACEIAYGVTAFWAIKEE
ncbi:methyltransferase domain-containing protein [Candidatus Thorarchaeota archaeon]|nr:MAG: methyltransferase domain-containing protein [Candidatus Thorarchaeota archaeon]